MGRTLLEVDDQRIFQKEVSQAVGTVKTDRLITISPSQSVNPFPTVVPVATDTSVQIRAKLLVRERVAGTSGCFEFIGTFENIGGTVFQVGTTTTVCAHSDSANWTSSFAIDGTNVEVNAVYTDHTLEVGKTIVWVMYLYIFSIGE